METDTDERPILFRWRWEIMRSDLPAPARHVAHTLGFHMDVDGAGCQVGKARLIAETGLSEAGVKKHLRLLEAEGWIGVGREARVDGGDEANSYIPAVPTERGHEVPPRGHEVPQGRARGAPGGGHEVPPNSTVNSTTNSITSVFDYWETERRRVLGTKRAVTMKATKARLSKIRARLDEGYPVADLKRAVDGCLGSTRNVENGFVDIELICRDQKHVTQYMAWADKATPKDPNLMTADEVEEWDRGR